MQYWTKTKPNRDGYWWTKINDSASIIYVMSVENVPYVVEGDEVYILDHKMYKNYLWGSAPICEPVGEKI